MHRRAPGPDADIEDAVLWRQVGVRADVVEEGGRVRRAMPIVGLGGVLERATLSLVQRVAQAYSLSFAGADGWRSFASAFASI